MSEGQKTFWLSAAFVVVIAISGVTLWKVQTSPTQDDLAALNAKVEQTNAKLAQLQKATASEALTKGLGQLADNIKSTNAALADIQRTVAAGNARDRLDALEKNIKAIDASLASLQKSQQAADITGTVTADQINPLNEKIKSLNDTLTDIQKSTSLDGVKTQLAALSSKLESANKTAGGGSQPREAVVFYLHMPNENNLPQKVASVQPLDIQFAKIGSADDNGQAALIIPKLKSLIEGRKDCTISVAGYADTLGGDQANLEISHKRAQNIAQKIKAAFSNVKVNEAAWGERRLKAWTPDGTANENNRRVDIAVNCKG